MTLTSRLMGWMFKLPPAETYDVVVEREIKVPMPDGVNLLADHYYPRGSAKLPTILVRSPYGRGNIWGLVFARFFAERGFQVLVQSCRGTFGSGGEFDAFRNERTDGLATVEWLKKQPWFSGEFATLGPSYLGLVQWAIAADAGPELKAMMTQITSSEFRNSDYIGGSFGLDTSVFWINLMTHQEDSHMAALSAQRSDKKLRPALNHFPLSEVDMVAVGKPVPYFREWLEYHEDNDQWKEVDFSPTVPQVTAPVLQLGGWYDIFLPHTFADYERLRGAGRNPYLTIGPWAHNDLRWMPTAVRESLMWLRAHVLNDRSSLREKPVRLYVMGANEWREYDAWPPAGYADQRWHLQADKGLSPQTPADSDPDHYRYDPADPTPAVGGASLSQNAGPKDNRALEARPDVLCYTSAPLEGDVEVIGAVRAELYVQSSLAHTDFFARLCAVDPSGKSINLCDGILRLRPGCPDPEADGCLKIAINLWPTAYRFQKGHRIRLQVSSGAHPLFVRNPGSGEPLATATTLCVAEQSVYHDPSHPSAIILPVKV